MADNTTPREFLRTAEFSPEKANQLFPHARRLSLGGLFISHTGSDTQRILKEVIDPVVFERFPADGYFLHNAKSGGADSYRSLVQAAIHWCDKFMLILSRQSLESEWVHAEVEWAIAHSRPIIVLKMDEIEWATFQRKLKVQPDNTHAPIAIIDFATSLETAQNQLGLVLDKLLQDSPRGINQGTAS